MTQSLETTLEKVSNINNSANRKIILDFDNYMIKSDKSERTRRNNLKYVLNYEEWLSKFNKTKILFIEFNNHKKNTTLVCSSNYPEGYDLPRSFLKRRMKKVTMKITQ